jgi:hypothetical protein
VDADASATASECVSETHPARRIRKGRPNVTPTFADVQRQFNLPLTEAAERLGVCVTLVKRICRKNGVARWPHRKLQSSRKMLMANEPKGDSAPRFDGGVLLLLASEAEQLARCRGKQPET